MLRSAHKQVLSGVLAADAVAQFVAEQGGVEQVRLANSPTALTPKQKAQAAAQLQADTIASVASPTLSAVTAAGNVNKHAVLSYTVGFLLSFKTTVNQSSCCAPY